MSSLDKERILSDIKDAMKSRDKGRLLTLRVLLSEIKYAEMNKSGDLVESDYISVVSRELKKRREAIPYYKEGGRQDLVDKEEAEAEILAAYLPEQLDEAEVDKIVESAIVDSGAAGIAEVGKVMGVLMPRIKGRADGGVVNKKVRAKLEDMFGG